MLMVNKYDFSTIDYSGYYYNIHNVIDKYKDVLLYVIIGGRNTGKTFSTLVECIRDKKVFAYLRRSIDDIKIITTRGKVSTTKGGLKGIDVDTSPMKSVNRAVGSNIRCLPVENGLSVFMECDKDLSPLGQPCGYAIALNAVGKIKGIDLSDVDVIIYDEFASTLETKAYNEETSILELYKTITRDSVHKGKRVPIIALSNASNINAPLITAFALENDLVQMIADGDEFKIIDRDGAKILVQLLQPNPDFLQEEHNSELYRITKGTKWNAYAYGNEFAYNDTSKVKGRDEFKSFISETIPLHKIDYLFNIAWDNKMYTMIEVQSLDSNQTDNSIFYLYENRKMVNPDIKIWNFNRESDRRLFYQTYNDTITTAVEANVLYFENYNMYEKLYWKEYLQKGT